MKEPKLATTTSSTFHQWQWADRDELSLAQLTKVQQ